MSPPPSLAIQAIVRDGEKLLEQGYETEDTDPASAFECFVKAGEVCGNAEALYRLGGAYEAPTEFGMKEDQEKRESSPVNFVRWDGNFPATTKSTPKGQLELRAETLEIGTPEERAQLRSHDHETRRRAQKLISQVRDCCPRPACVPLPDWLCLHLHLSPSRLS